MMSARAREEGKGEISSFPCCAMQVLLERPTNGGVITLATRVRNENWDRPGRRCESDDVVVTTEQMETGTRRGAPGEIHPPMPPDGLQRARQMST